MSSASPARELFGGSITADVAKDWMDASDLRQIPDNQEVLLSPSSDLTCIVEVLEAVKEGAAASDLEAAIRFHFDSLAHDNSASLSEVRQIFALPGTSPGAAPCASDAATPAPLLLVGEQRVKKFGRADSAEDRVRVWLALWRLSPYKNVDLVMSVNEPLQSTDTANPEDSSVAANGDGSAQELFSRAAASLSIRDWGLFAQ